MVFARPRSQDLYTGLGMGRAPPPSQGKGPGNEIGFLHSKLDVGINLRRSHFFMIIEKKINKSPSQIMLTVM